MSSIKNSSTCKGSLTISFTQKLVKLGWKKVQHDVGKSPLPIARYR